MSALPASLEDTLLMHPLPEIEQRRIEQRKWILNYVPKGGVGAEVGALRGHFSEVLLQWLQPRRMYLIDRWTGGGDFFGSDRDPALTDGGRMPTALARAEARWRTERFDGVERLFIEGRFPDCAGQIDDRLDWLYLDLDRAGDLEAVLAQLQASEALLAPKGILFGHGWWPNTSTERNIPFQALTQYTRKGRHELVAAGPYGQWALRRRGAWRRR